MTPQHTTFYRRNLPHLRMDGSLYFVTWRLHAEQLALTPAERDHLVQIIRRFKDERYCLHAYVAMDDHVHVLVEPIVGARLEDVVRSWKSFSANLFQRNDHRNGAIWQREYFDRIIRDEKEYQEKRDYILANPFKRWPELGGYTWAWALGIDE